MREKLFKLTVWQIIRKIMLSAITEINMCLSRFEVSLSNEPNIKNKREEQFRNGMEQKYIDELNYWRWLIKENNCVRSYGAPFEEMFYQWQRGRLLELGEALGLVDKESIDEWCSTRSVIEVGAGPYPSIATAHKGWRLAVAVDPLASLYIEEGLLTEKAVDIVYIETPGEKIPLPSDFADIIINENCLDHVSAPETVVSEMMRLLKPYGYLWFYVDLSRYVDNMHPHAMNENKVRKFLCDFELVHETINDGHAHPEAYGSYRGLFRKPQA